MRGEGSCVEGGEHPWRGEDRSGFGPEWIEHPKKFEKACTHRGGNSNRVVSAQL